MKAKEPASVYYTPSMVRALQRHIQRRLESEEDPDKLSQISRLLALSSDESVFEERYLRAKAFAKAHFDEDYVASLEARNFLVDEPFPLCDFTDEEWEREMENAEASGVASDEEVEKMFSIWKDYE